MTQNSYFHVQRGILLPILLGCAAAMLALGFFALDAPPLAKLYLASAVGVVILAFAFATLTVSDAGDSLAVRFGPLPLFRKTIPYREIAAVSRERSRILAGWGIHWTRKGWLWNVGGFDCVRIVTRTGMSTLVGSDDAAGLEAFLKARTGLRDA